VAIFFGGEWITTTLVPATEALQSLPHFLNESL
jgi:hypothetical protein